MPTTCCLHMHTMPGFLKTPLFLPQHSLLPKCERNLHLRTTHDRLSGALQEVVTHLLSPPPLHSSTICHGCFKTIWPGCANGWLFWERDGYCYSRRPSEKKGSLRDSARRGSGGSSCVCVWVCVHSKLYQWPSAVLGSCVAVGHRDCCWNWRFHTLAKPRQTLFILWQLLVVCSAFHPHHYQHLAFIKAKIGCFAYCGSKFCSLWWFNSAWRLAQT